MSTYAVIDPSTGIEVQAYPTATEADVEAAVAAATEVFATWSRQTSVAERAQLVRRVGELHTERREQLADI
ncbi:MAG TPA: aldehyde dehydrogenase family protein, partial [Microlunatus sp.]|nr:aldehyde dehydrogenase family protein [Microlunatus sp.]